MRPNTREWRERWLSTEDRILLCAASTQQERARCAVMAELLTETVDWPALIKRAEWHGMVPRLYALSQLLPEAWLPAAAQTALQAKARQQLVWNLCLQQELARLLGKFNDAGLAIMPLKGPVLADQLYGDVGLRPMGDLDLLVHVGDRTAAEQVLLQAGCRRAQPAALEADLYHQSYRLLSRTGANILIELHHDVDKSHTARLDVHRVWSGATRTTWAGREIWTMALPDLLLYLCLHAVKDGLGSLRPLLDIGLCVEQCIEQYKERGGTQFVWPELAETVRTQHLRSLVFLSLSESRRLLDAAVPDEFLAAIKPPQTPSFRLGRAIFQCRGGVLHSPLDSLGSPLLPLLLFLWEETARGKLRHMRRYLLPSDSFRARWTPAARLSGRIPSPSK